MCILPDTQEAIVSQAQWDWVQALRKNKHRPTKAKRQGLFPGILLCPDCGNKLHFATCKSVDGKQAYYACPSYKSRRAPVLPTIFGKIYCGNWCWNAFGRSMPMPGRTWRVSGRNGCNAAAPIRSATSVKIGNEWSRSRSDWLIWIAGQSASLAI